MKKPNQDNAATEAAEAPVKEAAGPAQEAQSAYAWEPHEEIPQGGGSYVRQPDGSLVKVEAEANEGNA